MIISYFLIIVRYYVLHILEFYSKITSLLSSSGSDFPTSLVKYVSGTINHQRLLKTSLYDKSKPVKNQYSFTELFNGLLNLSKEKEELIATIQRHLASVEITSHELLLIISNQYEDALQWTKYLLRVMKIEDPQIIIDPDYIDLYKPPRLVEDGPWSRTLDPKRLVIYTQVRDYDTYIPDLILGYDRFVEDKSLTMDVIKYYQLQKNHNIRKDELVLSQFLSLDKSPVLDTYLSEICDSNLILDSNNYRDLYKKVMKCDNFTMDKFLNNYSKIRSTVFSEEISYFSPRLIKFLLTIEVTK